MLKKKTKFFFSRLLLVVAFFLIAFFPSTGLSKTLPPPIIQEAQKSVVDIQSAQHGSFFPWSRMGFVMRFFHDFFETKSYEGHKFPYESSGSGVFIDELGSVITNAHVVSGAEKIRIINFMKQEKEAQVIGVRLHEDVALLKVYPGVPVEPIALGDSDALQVGEEVYAIGNPLGRGVSVTRGIVSAKDRVVSVGTKQLYRGMIQTDAAVNPGNSGGPLINTAGEMVGMITQKAWFASGMGYAIPVNRIRTLLPDLEDTSSRDRRLLDFQNQFGFLLKESASDGGSEELVVIEVVPGHKAGRVGLKDGDVLVRFDKEYPKNYEDLLYAYERMFRTRIYLELRRGERTFFAYLEAV